MGRQFHGDAVAPEVHFHLSGKQRPCVQKSGPAILCTVCAEHFAVASAERHTEIKLRIDIVREIQDHQQFVRLIPALTEKRYDILLPGVEIDPFKSLRIPVLFPECRLGQIELVEVPQQRGPLRRCPDCQFFARMGHEESGQVAARAAAGDHLPARHRQHKVLAVLVQHGIGDLFIEGAPLFRRRSFVVQDAAGPPVVFSEMEPEAILLRTAGGHGPFRGSVGKHQESRTALLHHRGQFPEERRPLQVLPAAVHILPVLSCAGVVQDRGHIDRKKTVQVIFLRPEQGICHQEIPHLRTFKIEHCCIRKGASVLIERRTIKIRRTEGILREARAGPFHDDADPLPVQCVHHGPELVRSSVPGGWRIETGALVSQRLVQRMLHQRQQLYMGIVHFCRVFRKLLPELRIRHSAVPSAGIRLESRERHLFRRVLLPRLHPGFIGPAESVRCRYHGSRARSQFGFPGVGICLQADLPVRPLDLILVEFPGLHAGKKDLEHAAFIKLPHLMTSSVPSVEGPDD